LPEKKATNEDKMVDKHIKRIAAPKSWPIQRKTSKYVTRPLPGGHPFSQGMAINTIMKELLGLVSTSSDANKILRAKKVLVDQVPRTEGRCIVGIMDTVSFPDANLNYRMLINTRGQLSMMAISKDEAQIKPCKITGKSMSPGGKIQLSLHDGNTMLTDNNEYKTGDTLLMELPIKGIKEYLKLEKGATVMLTGGSHVGETGKVAAVEQNKIIVEGKQGSIETKKELAMVIGKGKPAITLGG
jgi:small subunit ribosomal protein S4e